MQQATDFDPRTAAKKLMREVRSASLATLMPGSGSPYCSLVDIASAADGSPILLISALALHTKNLGADGRMSLLLQDPGARDSLAAPRITLMGTARPTNSDDPARRYLARQPSATAFARFKDFAFYEVAIQSTHLVAGFGRIVDLTPEEVLTDVSGAETLLGAEAEICAHMNDEHADAVRLYATKLLGAADAAWRCVGCDPEGLELQYERTALRLPFPREVTSPGQLRQVLKELAEQARSR